jgi:uncharacterized protein (DUF58 family)
MGPPMTTSTPVLPLVRPSMPEIWRRSLLAILGLGLSFAGALFSTVTRESGNVAATAILAGSSLLLSVWVGMTTVPYLARRVVSGVRWQDSLDFEVTRAGIVYVLATLLIGVAALNTGNNLLYLIVSTMLGAVLVSGVCSSLVLRRLGLHVDLPRHVFARDSALGSLELRNCRRWLPALSLSIVPPKERKVKERWHTERGTLGFPPHWPPERQWLRLNDLKIRRQPAAPSPPPVFRGTIHFALIPPRSSAKSEIELRFERRGLYRQDAFAVVTVFPFGLLVKRRSMDVAHELVVYPAVDATAELAQILPAIASDLSSLHAGIGQDLLRIRPYESGDAARHVDWKATAKSGALKVREFARDEQVRLRIIFDNPAQGEVSAESYERGVRLAASLAWYFARVSQMVSFVAPGFPASADVWEFLRYLALAQPMKSNPILEDLRDTGEFNLIVTNTLAPDLAPSIRSMSRICTW